MEHAGLEVVPVLIEGSAADVDPKLIRSVTELRNVMSPDIARLAALRATKADREQIRVCADAMLNMDQTLDELTEASLKFWKRLILASENVAYRLAFNSMIVSFVEDTAAFRPVIEKELRAGPLYVIIAKAIESGNEKMAVKKTAAGLFGGSAILNLIEQIEHRC